MLNSGVATCSKKLPEILDIMRALSSRVWGKRRGTAASARGAIILLHAALYCGKEPAAHCSLSFPISTLKYTAAVSYVPISRPMQPCPTPHSGLIGHGCYMPSRQAFSYCSQKTLFSGAIGKRKLRRGYFLLPLWL